MGILYRQAPDVKVIADSPDDIDNKASVNSHSQTQTHEDEGHLVNVVTQGAGPTNSDMRLQPWTQRVKDTVDERVDQHIATRKAGLDEMGGDDTADRVRVDKTGVEDKGYEMLMQYQRLEEEVRRDESPCCSEGEQAEECDAGFLATGTAGFHYVLCTTTSG